MGCHFLLVGVFLTQGSNPYLLCPLNWQAAFSFFFLITALPLCVCALSHVHLFVAPWTVGCQAPLPVESVDCNLPGYSVYGIFRQEILEWVAISYSRGSSWPRDRTWVSCAGKWILHHWAHLGSPYLYMYKLAFLTMQLKTRLLKARFRIWFIINNTTQKQNY